MTHLIKYEAARQALTEAVMFDEVMSIKNVAEQAALYAKQAKDTDLIQKATEIRVRAERKAGEMLAKAKDAGDLRHSGNPQWSASSTIGLKEIGISKNESSRYQSLASMSAEHFETAVETAKATAGEVTTAFMLREAAKHKPAKKISKADKRRIDEIKAAQERGVSMLTTYARLTLTALRAQDRFSDEECDLLSELAEAIREVSANER